MRKQTLRWPRHTQALPVRVHVADILLCVELILDSEHQELLCRALDICPAIQLLSGQRYNLNKICLFFDTVFCYVIHAGLKLTHCPVALPFRVPGLEV